MADTSPADTLRSQDRRARNVFRVLAAVSVAAVVWAAFNIAGPFTDPVGACVSSYSTPASMTGESLAVEPAGLSLIPLSLRCSFAAAEGEPSVIVTPSPMPTYVLLAGIGGLALATFLLRRSAAR